MVVLFIVVIVSILICILIYFKINNVLHDDHHLYVIEYCCYVKGSWVMSVGYRLDRLILLYFDIF